MAVQTTTRRSLLKGWGRVSAPLPGFHWVHGTCRVTACTTLGMRRVPDQEALAPGQVFQTFSPCKGNSSVK